MISMREGFIALSIAEWTAVVQMTVILSNEARLAVRMTMHRY